MQSILPHIYILHSKLAGKQLLILLKDMYVSPMIITKSHTGITLPANKFHLWHSLVLTSQAIFTPNFVHKQLVLNL